MNVLHGYFVKVAIVLLAVATICFGLYFSFVVSLNKQKQDFEADANAVSASFRSAMDVVDGIATSLDALQASRPEAQASFAHTVIDNYPFVRGFGRFNRVESDQAVSFSASRPATASGMPAVWWFDDKGNRVTFGVASGSVQIDAVSRQYFPVSTAYMPSMQAVEDNRSRLDGFDLGSLPELAEAIRQAAELGQTGIVNAPASWPTSNGVLALRGLYRGGVIPEKINERRDALVGGFWLEIDFHALGLPVELIEAFGLSFRLIESDSEFYMDDSTVLLSRPLPESGLLFSSWLDPYEWVSSFRVADNTYTISMSRKVGMTPLSFMLWLSVASGILGTLMSIAVLNAKRLMAVQKQRLESDKLFLEQQRAAVTLLHVGDAVISIDIDGGIQYANKAAAEMLEVVVDNIIGRPIQSIFRMANEERGQSVCKKPADNIYYLSEDVNSCDRYLLKVDGSRIAVNETVSPVHDAEKNRIGSVVVLRDVTAEKQLTEQLEHQINHDPLTGLANRLNFESRMRELFTETTAGESGHGLCLIDLDRFKQVNDTCGHAAGDRLLQDLAVALGDRIRAEDVLARLGGDEFAVVIQDCDQESALSLANRLHRFFNNYHFDYDNKIFPIRGSIGLVHFDPAVVDFEEVVSAADAACYKAKQGGRNAVYVYTDDDRTQNNIHVEEMWLPSLERAITGSGFELHVQPICAVEGGVVESAGFHEFFVRLPDQDNRGKLYSPSQFIKSAERSGVMGQIDEWVIGTALESIAGRPDSFQSDMFSINLSSTTIERCDFYQFLARELLKNSVSGAQLCFDISEEVVLNNFEASKSAINNLKSLGCKVALDDFGAGVSSLSSLRELSVDFLKIDGRFTAKIEKSPLDQSMVRSINSFASTMGLQTIAEKVESQSACKQLAEIGVHYVQGYAIARPVSAQEYLIPRKAA